MKMAKKQKKQSTLDWSGLAERRLKRILKAAQGFPTLAKLGPKSHWQVEIQMVGKTMMTRLNQSYRGKAYPTDILSFPSIAPFRQTGLLGELVICLPTLKAQAKELCHSPELELEVLLIHGVLHLLGLDHEKDEKQAEKMARWEGRLLLKVLPQSQVRPSLGLIHRSTSGMG